MSREYILHRVRTALGRSVGDPPHEEAPPVRLAVPSTDLQTRVRQFEDALQNLAGVFHDAGSREAARDCVAALLGDEGAVASNAAFLADCGITGLPRVRTGFEDPTELREVASHARFGITSADYALADTGSLVMISSREEARIVSLLPPVHIAVVPRERLLSGLDELLTIVPEPSRISSSMVLITGPSRTADIEQILVRGVHGPGAIHVVLV